MPKQDSVEPTDALRIEKLSKIYPAGKVHALVDLDLRVRRGDFFALLGNNGAGKSTTIGIIAGLVHKTAGKVHIMGLDIDTDHARARKYLGLVPQEFNFGHFEKVYDIIVNCAGFYGLSPKKAADNTEKYLRKLGLWDKRNEVSRNLSGGMKRRLMIVRALVHEPELLILDEPTAGVDVQQRHDTWNFLRELNATGTTILLTTHYLEEAETLCRNLAIISQGRIAAAGSMRKMLSSTATHTLIVETATPLEQCPHLPEGFSGYLEDGVLHIKFASDLSLHALIDELERQNITLTSMSREHSRLEDLFLESTTDEQEQS